MSTLRPKINLFILGLFLLLTIAGCAPNDKNFDFWGIDRPRFERYTLSEDKVRIDGPKEQYWEIIYEQKKDSVFTGLVRHVNTDYDPYFPILTHDILVTTGDFADPDRVNTRVSDHHFYWVATDENEPQGTINLLHIVTIDPVVYDQLMNIHPDDMVSVTGREILEIRHITSKGVWDRTWRDAGCNTLLVTEVKIEDVSAP
ncbi:MAG TPA: hypothetical protein PLT26_01155 [Anaerolineaceae bacterium]|nr:hypothetical protein [Anaerolineaceae bacterium]HQH85383.1 hypothetical protein [Anaerolineaceae bacterium]